MGLHVGILGVKKLLQSVYSQLFNLIHDLASAVIPGSGVALRILVCQYRTHGFQDLGVDKILGSDQFQSVGLTFTFTVNHIEYRGVSFHSNCLISIFLPVPETEIKAGVM